MGYLLRYLLIMLTNRGRIYWAHWVYFKIRYYCAWVFVERYSASKRFSDLRSGLQWYARDLNQKVFLIYAS